MMACKNMLSFRCGALGEQIHTDPATKQFAWMYAQLNAQQNAHPNCVPHSRMQLQLEQQPLS
jgi:hypothetical protein